MTARKIIPISQVRPLTPDEIDDLHRRLENEGYMRMMQIGEPRLAELVAKYKGKGYDMVAVAMSYDPPSYVVNYAQTRKLPFKVAIDNTGAVAKAWGDVQLTPTSFLVNKKGEIVKRYVGQPDFNELHRLIEKLLAEA